MKKREDSFFGIHFDFHASRDDTVGIIYKPEIVAEALDRIKPDFVQCDTKGHDGISSYRTKIGNKAKIKHDVLKMWRELTEERDIALYAHHSGVFDKEIVLQHPNWAVCNEKGERSPDFVSVFSPYADVILIPQLLELAGEYRLNGAWIDGDCWCAKVDYSPYAVSKWKEINNSAPPMPGDKNYEEYREFCSWGFKNFVLKYITAVKSRFPEFQITSNWIYSAYMPEAVTEPVDFLSGDYSSEYSVASGRVNGRVLAARKMPWELMAWGQHLIGGSYLGRNRSTKGYAQYCQEAAEIIALGGAFEFFNIMYGNGGILQEWAIPLWERVADFCRQREKFCFNAKPVKQIAVLLPEKRTPTDSEYLYSTNYPEFVACEGWIHALQDSQQSCEILLESELDKCDLSEYPLIILPCSYAINEDTSQKLRTYLFKGGRLIIDAGSAFSISPVWGKGADTGEKKLVFLSDGNALAPFEDEVYSLKNEKGEKFAELYPQNFYTDQTAEPAAVINDCGAGKAVKLAFNLGNIYHKNRTPVIRSFLRSAIEKTGFSPKVRVSGSGFADLTVMEKDGRLMINLINYAGTHNDPSYRSYDEIPPLGPLEISVECGEAKSVYLEPEHKKLKATYNEGRALIKLDRLYIHSIIVIEV